MHYEVDEALCLFETLLLSVDEEFIEITVNNIAAKLLHMVDQLEEVLFHEFMDQSVHEGVVEF